LSPTELCETSVVKNSQEVAQNSPVDFHPISDIKEAKVSIAQDFNP